MKLGDDINEKDLIEEMPESVCAITQTLMYDPVTASDGHTYDREAITAWLRISTVSPITKQNLPDTRLVPNWNLRGAVTSRLEKLRGAPGTKKRQRES